MRLSNLCYNRFIQKCHFYAKPLPGKCRESKANPSFLNLYLSPEALKFDGGIITMLY